MIIKPDHFNKNHHPKDFEISFDNDNHEYFVNKKKISYSVSELINNFFPKFDSDYWSKIKAVEQLQQDGEPYNDAKIKETQNELIITGKLGLLMSRSFFNHLKPKKQKFI